MAKSSNIDLKGSMESAAKAATDDVVGRALRGLELPLEPAALSAVEAAVNAGLRDQYGDGDQTPVTTLRKAAGQAACAPLRTAWSSAMDVQEAVLCRSENPVHTAAYVGDYGKLAALIEEARGRGGERAVFEAIERRVSLLRLNAISYSVLGARMIPGMGHLYLGPPKQPVPEQWKECTELLVSVGVNVNARDIAGYSVLSIAGMVHALQILLVALDGALSDFVLFFLSIILMSTAGYNSTEESLELVPLLSNAGADPNIQTRFGEPIIMSTIMAGDTKAFKALLGVGADLDAGDNDGLTSRKMASTSPIMLAAIAEASRSMALEESGCSSCSKKGALMRCTRCQGTRYCDSACQRLHWKSHKKECTQLWEDGSVTVDIDFKTMLATELAPGVPIPKFQSMLTGKAGKRMRPRASDKIFVVKVQKPFSPASAPTGSLGSELADDRTISFLTGESAESQGGRLGREYVGAVKVTSESSAFFLVSREGAGAEVHSLLQSLTAPEPGELVSGKRYYPARWQPAKKEGKIPSVLRICYAKALPHPKKPW